MAYSHGDPFMLQARTGKAFNNSVPVEHGTVFTGFAATQEITRVGGYYDIFCRCRRRFVLIIPAE